MERAAQLFSSGKYKDAERIIEAIPADHRPPELVFLLAQSKACLIGQLVADVRYRDSYEAKRAELNELLVLLRHRFPSMLDSAAGVSIKEALRNADAHLSARYNRGASCLLIAASVLLPFILIILLLNPNTGE
jgi:hypothetical protein